MSVVGEMCASLILEKSGLMSMMLRITLCNLIKKFRNLVVIQYLSRTDKSDFCRDK